MRYTPENVDGISLDRTIRSLRGLKRERSPIFIYLLHALACRCVNTGSAFQVRFYFRARALNLRFSLVVSCVFHFRSPDGSQGEKLLVYKTGAAQTSSEQTS